VNHSERDRREAERSARRAQRLAQRAEERARRKEEQARRAAERAERLAERVRRRPARDRERGQSIEDVVDDVAEEWTRKAGEWLEGKTDRSASRDRSSEAGDGDSVASARSARRARRMSRRTSGRRDPLDAPYGTEADGHWWGQGWGHRVRRRRHRRRRSGNLYRDSRRGKVCGVCAGIADYLDIATWKVRLGAVLGLLFIPQITLPLYFGLYFLMDDKPYFRRVTDRFDDAMADMAEETDTVASRPDQQRASAPESQNLNNVQAMKVAKEKFSDIEDRLRAMETHVTSSRFELQRELNRISGEGAS
jgi:phage shock protein C